MDESMCFHLVFDRYFLPSAAKEVAEEDWACDEAKERDYWAAAKKSAAADITKMDTNEDGVVSKEEYLAAGAGTEEEFDLFDTNKDGSLDREELEARARHQGFAGCGAGNFGDPPPPGLACIG